MECCVKMKNPGIVYSLKSFCTVLFFKNPAALHKKIFSKMSQVCVSHVSTLTFSQLFKVSILLLEYQMWHLHDIRSTPLDHLGQLLVYLIIIFNRQRKRRKEIRFFFGSWKNEMQLTLGGLCFWIDVMLPLPASRLI